MLKWILEPEARIDNINIRCPCFRQIKYIYGQTEIARNRHLDRQ